MIRIVDLRDYKLNEGEVLIKVDRSSVLGNPFYMSNESERNKVCIMYDIYFRKILSKGKVVLCSDLLEYDVNKALNKVDKEAFINELRRIYKIAKNNDVALGCWCFPKKCHSESIKSFLEKYL